MFGGQKMINEYPQRLNIISENQLLVRVMCKEKKIIQVSLLVITAIIIDWLQTKSSHGTDLLEAYPVRP